MYTTYTSCVSLFLYFLFFLTISFFLSFCCHSSRAQIFSFRSFFILVVVAHITLHRKIRYLSSSSSCVVFLCLFALQTIFLLKLTRHFCVTIYFCCRRNLVRGRLYCDAKNYIYIFFYGSNRFI